eukprot:IDg3433t1
MKLLLQNALAQHTISAHQPAFLPHRTKTRTLSAAESTYGVRVAIKMVESISVPQNVDSADPFVLGVFTDIQYAEKPDKEFNYMGTAKMRRYSTVLAKAERAVAHFNAHDVAHAIHLGDIIDGNETRDRSEADLCAVMHALAPLGAPLLHVLGNHCLDLGRSYTTAALALPSPPHAAHYTTDLSASWRLIVLDTMALSLHSPTEADAAIARSHIEAHAEHLNATGYNGGLGEAQTTWLRAELVRARATSVNIIVAAHHPFALEVAPAKLLAWNKQDFLALLTEFRGTVRAVFTGHYHYGGYGLIDDVHHVGFESILDSQSEFGSHGIVYLHDDRIEIVGVGDMSSRILKFSIER